MGRSEQPKYWFKARRYGWGWTPDTWQAWAVLAAYTAVLVGSAVLLLPDRKDEAVNFVGLVAFVLIFLSTTLLLIGIGLRFGEKPSWNFGGKDKK